MSVFFQNFRNTGELNKILAGQSISSISQHLFVENDQEPGAYLGISQINPCSRTSEDVWLELEFPHAAVPQTRSLAFPRALQIPSSSSLFEQTQHDDATTSRN
jgi:hypothetical protein